MRHRWVSSGMLPIVVAVAACGSGRHADRTAAPVTGSDPTTAITTTTTSAPRTVPTTPPTTSPRSTTTVAAGPPYRLTEFVLPLVDSSRPTVSHGQEISAHRSLPTTVWLPATPGRWPLIVFAHGFQVGPAPYTSLVQAWAAHGYAVAVPDFPLTDQARAGANLDENDINNQPADVRFVTDQIVTSGSPVAARIDRNRIAVAGHSDGAETALAAATDPVPAGQPTYEAVIVMSGQTVPGAAGRNPPILVTQGTADDINPPSLGQGVYDEATDPRWYLTIRGGGHLPPLMAGSPWLPGIESVTESFLDAYSAKDAPVSGLALVAGRYPDLTLSGTG